MLQVYLHLKKYLSLLTSAEALIPCFRNRSKLVVSYFIDSIHFSAPHSFELTTKSMHSARVLPWVLHFNGNNSIISNNAVSNNISLRLCKREGLASMPSTHFIKDQHLNHLSGKQQFHFTKPQMEQWEINALLINGWATVNMVKGNSTLLFMNLRSEFRANFHFLAEIKTGRVLELTLLHGRLT